MADTPQAYSTGARKSPPRHVAKQYRRPLLGRSLHISHEMRCAATGASWDTSVTLVVSDLVGTTSYFIRRFLLIIPTFLGITLLVFAITRLVPGGPIERMLNEAMLNPASTGITSAQSVASRSLSDEQLEQLRVYYGLDKPILVSYVNWLGKVLVLDLGRSTRYNEPVWDTIKHRFPISIFYGITTLILTYAVCIPLGIAKAIRHNSHFDNVSSGFVFLGSATRRNRRAR